MTTLLITIVFVVVITIAFIVVLLEIGSAVSVACERKLKRNAQDEKPQHKKAA